MPVSGACDERKSSERHKRCETAEHPMDGHNVVFNGSWHFMRINVGETVDRKAYSTIIE
jgi:hypothetical protein